MKKVLLSVALGLSAVSGSMADNPKDLKTLVEKSHKKAQQQFSKSAIGKMLNQSKSQVQQFAADPFMEQTRRQAENLVKSQIMAEGMTPDKQAMVEARIDTLIFISRSIPENNLLALYRQGIQRGKVMFVLRGWNSDDVADAFAYVDSIREKLGGQEPSIVVYPQAFDAYKIKAVPAVVHRDGKDWYLIKGALSIEATLDAIRKRKFDKPLSRLYPIIEESQIKRDQAAWARTDWNQVGKNYRQGIIETMRGTVSLPWADKTERYSFKPLYTLDYDMKDHKGNTVFPKGTKINPLAIAPNGKEMMVFVDGTDDWQVAFAKNVQRKNPKAVVMYTKLGKLAEKSVRAFPLNNALLKRVGVRVVPTVYMQRGVEFDVRTFNRMPDMKDGEAEK